MKPKKNKTVETEQLGSTDYKNAFRDTEKQTDEKNRFYGRTSSIAKNIYIYIYIYIYI